MNIVLTLWQGTGQIVSTLIDNWQAWVALTLLALPHIGLRRLQH